MLDARVAVITRGSSGIGPAVTSKLEKVGARCGLGIRCSVVCPGGVATNFAMDDGRGRTPETVAAMRMMAAEDVADVVLFTLERPAHMRLMETALRPTSEASWG